MAFGKPHKKFKHPKAYKRYKLAKMKKPVFRAGNGYGVKPQPFPTRLYTRAVYMELSGHAACPSYGAINQISYNLSNITNCNYSAGALASKSVANWTELAALYHKYIVMGVKYVISFTDPSIDGLQVGYSLFRNVDFNNQLLTNYLTVPTTYWSGIVNSGSQKKSFFGYVKPWSILGISKAEYLTNSDQYATNFTQAPTSATQEAFLRVLIANQNVSHSTAETINYTIKLTYYVKCYSRIWSQPE